MSFYLSFWKFWCTFGDDLQRLTLGLLKGGSTPDRVTESFSTDKANYRWFEGGLPTPH